MFVTETMRATDERLHAPITASSPHRRTLYNILRRSPDVNEVPDELLLLFGTSGVRTRRISSMYVQTSGVLRIRTKFLRLRQIKMFVAR